MTNKDILLDELGEQLQSDVARQIAGLDLNRPSPRPAHLIELAQIIEGYGLEGELSPDELREIFDLFEGIHTQREGVIGAVMGRAAFTILNNLGQRTPGEVY